MTMAKSDLVREVCGELMALGLGQSPAAEDQAWIEQRINPTLAQLAKVNAYYIPDSETIDDAVFNPLVTYLTQVVAPKFGLDRDEAVKMAAENEMRRLSRIGRGTGQNLKVDPALIIQRRRSYFRIYD